MAFLNINGPIAADTVYSENVLVAKDVEFTLPEVAPVVVDVEAMGTMSVPLWARLDDMEMTVTKIGLDMGLGNMLTPTLKPLEFRFPQEAIDANGDTKIVPCKAFIKGMNKTVPGIGITPGETSSNDLTYMVTRYQLFVDGKEMILVDRLASIVRINGKDYTSGIQSML